MNEHSYEEYKKNFSRDQKKKESIKNGKSMVVGMIILSLLCLYLLPFHADNVREIRGDELKNRKAYYIENLQILHTQIDDSDSIYCVAKFYDADQNAWLISFTPDYDEQLVKQIKLAQTYEKQLSGSFNSELDLETSGYFYMEKIPSGASSYYSVYGRKYIDSESANMLELNADYLCKEGENYTLKALLRPGYALASFVAVLIGMIRGIILLIKYRPRKSTQP